MNLKKYGFDNEKLEKRDKLLEKEISIYPYSYTGTQKISEVTAKALEIEKNGEKVEFDVVIAGRIWAKREMGKALFMDIKEETGKIQIYLRKNEFDEKTWESIFLLDIGDIIGVKGVLFRTRTGELTVKTDEFSILAKTVVPIPVGKETEDKVYYRVSDPESKYRERYLHWMLNRKEQEKIVRRSKIISALRNKMEAEGFLEVTTPTIEFIYGGAEARPFKTSIWALGHKDAFLRISPELYLKRYIVAGFKKVFTICQNFRNEGIDKSHNPEFTMMEWYESYTDYNEQMVRFENLIADVCKEIHGTTKINYQGVDLDFTPPWKRITVLDALKQFGGIDASSISIDKLKKELKKNEIEYDDNITWGSAVMKLFDAVCEEHLIQPSFVCDHPIDVSPLTKVKRGDSRLVERFEPYVFKMELGNAYSELSDPVDQLERFIAQKEKGAEQEGYENHPLDSDFIKAIGCGMPPTGGAGLGIDRFIMLLTDASSIRDIIPFPMILPV